MTIRRYRARDRPAVAAMSDAVSPASLHQRFFTGYPRLPSAFLDHLDRGAEEPGIALLAVLDTAAGPVVLGVGELMVAGSEPQHAELGLLVRDTHHRRGIGLKLTEALIEHARDSGVVVVRAAVLAENHAVRSLIRTRYPDSVATASRSSSGYELGFELVLTLPSDRGSLARWELSAATSGARVRP